MPIRTRENQYRGVNAHLHSFLQNEPGGWWEVFHGAHINDMTAALDRMLPQGYYALNEKSLQIRDSGVVFEEPQRRKPDVSIYYQSSGTPYTPVPMLEVDTPYATIAATETLTDEDYLRSVVIYRIDQNRKLIPITQIELLSPANKPPASDYRRYLEKRKELLERGINLIEIDYLHQTRSPVAVVPVYRLREKNAFPYNILVTDIRESLEVGTTLIYAIGVDEPLPKVAVPLLAEEAIAFDFGTVYQESYSKQRFYGEIAVDYEALPMNFESYSEDDQARIRAVMERAKAKLVPPPPPA